MKHTLLLIVLLISCNAYSQQYSWKVLTGVPFEVSRYEDVHFINPQTGWVLKSSSTNNLYKTTNGGINWENLSQSQLSFSRCIGFANAMTGWIGTYIGSWPSYVAGIYKTTDGGITWSDQFQAFTDTTIGICGISVVDENNVFACGRWYEPAKFCKTTNGGTNWTTVDMSAYATRLIDCYFTTPDSGFVIGGIGSPIEQGRGVVLFTSDGGSTWVNRYTTINNKQWGWKIDFPGRDTGYISLEKFTSSGGSSYFLKTTDGGVTWQENLFQNVALDEEGIGFINNSTGWIGGWDFSTYKTTDGGQTWNSDPWGMNVNRFRFFGDTVGYAVGQRVYKYSRDSTSSINTVSSEIPNRPDLSQNYPNPFNPSTTIRFHVLDYEDTKLTIFDVLGQEVAVLVNQRMYPGVYEYTFDASDLQTGVYFYRIETLRYTETKRMVLVK